MIISRTTFIVGAGASVPYGLPVADDLWSKAAHLKSASNLYQLIRFAFPRSAARLNDWIEDLRQHPSRSIDAFLQNRQDDSAFVELGRAVIAGLMGEALLQSKEGSPATQDWIELVAGKMAGSAARLEDFINGNSGLRFITFNFDSVIEDRLERYVSLRYRNPEQRDLKAALAQIAPVLHVHGHLSNPPIGSMITEHDGPAEQWVEWIRRAAEGVNVVHDSIDHEFLGKVSQTLVDSKYIVFLGFSYAPENLQRLGIPGSIDDRHQVFGSCKGIKVADRAWIRDRFSSLIHLTEERFTSREVLENVHWFRD